MFTHGAGLSLGFSHFQSATFTPSMVIIYAPTQCAGTYAQSYKSFSNSKFPPNVPTVSRLVSEENEQVRNCESAAPSNCISRTH